MRERYGKNTFGQCCLLARRLVEAGTRVVEVVWPKVANSDNHSWDVHSGLSKRMKTQSAPMLDAGLSSLIDDLDERGLLSETLVVAVGEFGRSPQRGVSTSGNNNEDDGRDHWPYCYTGVIAGAGVKRGFVWGKSDKTASAPVENAVHPRELLATIYHSVGIDPATIVMNHLNQPRLLVEGRAGDGDPVVMALRQGVNYANAIRGCGRFSGISDNWLVVRLSSERSAQSEYSALGGISSD